MADKESEKTNAAVINTSKAIKQLLDKIVAWENYWRIIKSKNLLARFNRKWRALSIAQRLKYLLIQDVTEFEQEKGKAIASIKENNPRLADELEKFKAVPENTIPRMAHLLAKLNNDPGAAEADIKTHGLDIIAGLNSLKNDEDADEIKRIIIEISGAEVAEIDKCIADLDAWQSFRVGNNVEFFQNRVKIYMGGGKTESQEFIGLGKFFKDWELVKQIKESVALRMLLKYQTQFQWFNNARKVVAYSIWKGGWEGFSGKPNGLHYNLTKGKNYIDMIRRVFGNKDVANELEGLYYSPDGPGEVPKLWLPHFDEILTRIKNPTYLNRDVILPAHDDLKRILERRKAELSAIDARILEDLGIALRRFFKKAVSKSRNIINFDSLIKGEQKLLEKEIDAEKREFINVLLDHGEAVIDFANGHHNQIEEQDKDITYYIGAYVYLTRAKLKTLANRLRRVPIFEAVEKMREIEEKEEVIGGYAAKQLEKAAREAEKSQLVLGEMIKHAEFVDKQLTSVALNYYPRNGKTILEPAYLA